MPSYPAKPFIVPHDDWFNNSSSLENKSTNKETKEISTFHDFFYEQSNVKVGGSDNHIQTKLEKKSLKKSIISSLETSEESFLDSSKEKYIYSNIPIELKLVKKRSIKGKSFYKNLSKKNISNFRSFFLDLKSIFLQLLNKIK